MARVNIIEAAIKNPVQPYIPHIALAKKYMHVIITQSIVVAAINAIAA
jgi:hypothetical protein